MRYSLFKTLFHNREQRTPNTSNFYENNCIETVTQRFCAVFTTQHRITIHTWWIKSFYRRFILGKPWILLNSIQNRIFLYSASIVGLSFTSEFTWVFCGIQTAKRVGVKVVEKLPCTMNIALFIVAFIRRRSTHTMAYSRYIVLCGGSCC